MNIAAIIIGAVGSTILALWDNATDYGVKDAAAMWFLGPVHLPTFFVGAGLSVTATFLWAFGLITSRSTVGAVLLGTLVAGITAYLLSFLLPIFNGIAALLGKLVGGLAPLVPDALP